MHAAEPDHIAVTGDLVNLALDDEVEAARGWLETVGPPDLVSVVPGNHDAYVPGALARVRKAWGALHGRRPAQGGSDDTVSLHSAAERRFADRRQFGAGDGAVHVDGVAPLGAGPRAGGRAAGDGRHVPGRDDPPPRQPQCDGLFQAADRLLALPAHRARERGGARAPRPHAPADAERDRGAGASGAGDRRVVRFSRAGGGQAQARRALQTCSRSTAPMGPGPCGRRNGATCRRGKGWS